MNQRRAVVLLGPPGAGKTTLARTLAGPHRIGVIEIGNLLKREVQRGTPLGEQIRPATTAGALVPLPLVKEVISTALKDLGGALVLFDGFPRSVEQLDLFFDLLKDQNLTLGAVIVLTLDEQAAARRLSGRRICSKCGTLHNLGPNSSKAAETCVKCGGELIQRPDDRADVVRERFKSYQRETLPVIEHFERDFGGLTCREAATPGPDEVASRVWQRVEGPGP